MRAEYRNACPEDAPACIGLRAKTRENAFTVQQLEALGITARSWAAGIADGSLPGHVCQVDGHMAGYCFGDKGSGEVVVLALLPEYEGHGFGRALLDLVVQDLHRAGFERLFLSCAADPAVRSHGFYRHLGWRWTGQFDASGDQILEHGPSV